MSAHESKTTTDHKTIQKWVEDRNGKPAMVEGTGSKSKGGGLLRIDFQDNGKEDNLKEISWDEFFKIFDDNKLNFLYQEKTKEGDTSRFCKFVDKE